MQKTKLTPDHMDEMLKVNSEEELNEMFKKRNFPDFFVFKDDLYQMLNYGKDEQVSYVSLDANRIIEVIFTGLPDKTVYGGMDIITGIPSYRNDGFQYFYSKDLVDAA